MWEKNENKQKRGRVWPILKKRNEQFDCVLGNDWANPSATIISTKEHQLLGEYHTMTDLVSVSSLNANNNLLSLFGVIQSSEAGDSPCSETPPYYKVSECSLSGHVVPSLDLTSKYTFSPKMNFFSLTKCVLCIFCRCEMSSSSTFGVGGILHLT